MKPADHVADPVGDGAADIPPKDCCCDAPFPSPCTDGSQYVQVWPCVEGVKGDCSWFDLSSLTFAPTPAAAAAKKPCGGGANAFSVMQEAVAKGFGLDDLKKLAVTLDKLK
jgi:hypothetical protein